IIDSTIEYNIDVVTVSTLSKNQIEYMSMTTSGYFQLPPDTVGLGKSSAFIALDPNGQPPAFDGLCKAINMVLKQDHPTETGPSQLELRANPLTPGQSAQIAAEIIWNRSLYPTPTPSR